MFRHATDPGAIEARKLLMFDDLFALLSAGKLEAWGFQVEPHPELEPLQLPPHSFFQRPVIADCEADVVAASGLLSG